MRALWLTLMLSIVLAANAFGQMSERERLRWVRSAPRIDSIVIEGNSFYSDSEVKDRLYAKEWNWWRSLKGDRRIEVQRETFSRDTLEIKYMYLTEGFLGVQVQHRFEMLPDSNALVRIDVAEGRRFRYDTTWITGDTPAGLNGRFSKVSSRLEPGEPVNPVDIRDIEFELKTYLANRGYPYAEIDHDIDTTQVHELARVIFTARADSLVRFGDVDIVGTQRFPEYVARRELKIDSGKVYRREDILESQRRLFESGYFSTLQLNRAEDSPNRLRPDFTLRVRERKTRYVSTELGAVGQSNLRDLAWLVSAGVGKRNIFGSRRGELSVSYFFSLGEDSRVLQNNYRLRFTEPWFLGLRMPLTLGFEWEPTLRVPDNEYKRRSYSVSAETQRRFGRQTRVAAGIEYESLKLSDFPEDISIPGVDETTSGRRSLFVQFRQDSRDNLFVPSRGAYIDILADYFGGFLGGDDDFYRVEASWSTYQRVWPGWIGAVRFKVGFSEPFGDSDSLLTDDRFLLGGANSVRSFRENRLGPLDENGNPIGSRYIVVFNQEFRWKTVQIFNEIPLIGSFFKSFPLWQSVFVDVGNGFLELDHVRLDRLAVAYGTGIQILSPAGPIRLDYARRVDTEQFDFATRWHFTILYAF
ncbi:BamA/TamA family outer membrane protein [candidate division GN15 bacterium]|nr:BamA/TamA family outer membrane protein [candidate division GN15 bacterium]